ncbi:hypothetical protein [Streptomyces sp. NK15101]|uniref:hypothetical protein n=1 Tax=Streptomyces sp. NK15101 TaxID=2873261 RepID=UPI001CED1F51|nr:hypothetical protein [Streptomyces sp. NK15101]
MTGAVGFRFGAERSYPLAHAGPDPRFSESLIHSVAAGLVGYGYPPFESLEDWAGLGSALAGYLYERKDTT